MRLDTPFIHSEFTALFESSPIRVIDVGASGGFQPLWKALSPQNFIQFLGFEPDENEMELLEKNASSNEVFLNAAVMDKKSPAVFYRTKSLECASVIPPNPTYVNKFPRSERFDVIAECPMEAITIDKALADKNYVGADFLKLNTQGSELAILKGAEQTLRSTFAVEVEVEFGEMYIGQPLFADVDSHLRQKGYEIFDLKRGFWKRNSGKGLRYRKGQLIFAEALYLKNIDTWIDELEDDLSLRKEKLLKAISICLLYEYPDYALEILSKGERYFSDAERSLIGTEINTKFLGWNASAFRHFLAVPGGKAGAEFLSSIFSSAYQILRKWHLKLRASSKRWYLRSDTDTLVDAD